MKLAANQWRLTINFSHAHTHDEDLQNSQEYAHAPAKEITRLLNKNNSFCSLPCTCCLPMLALADARCLACTQAQRPAACLLLLRV